MSYDRIRAEEEAVQSLMELYQQSKKCQQLYERAGMGIPEALQRFLGMNGNSHKAGQGTLVHRPASLLPRDQRSRRKRNLIGFGFMLRTLLLPG